MADDSLVDKVFGYVYEVGGFAELPFLLKPLSPLAIDGTEREAMKWIKRQGGLAIMEDQNGEIAGVRIDLRKKMCQQYVVKGSCRRAQGKCKFWHLCKSFIEGNCDGSCNRSHNFLDEGNKGKTKKLKLDKRPNGTVKSVVAWSLPQVCLSYLRTECKSDKCPYLHVCPKAVRGSPCKCVLSHDLTESHNIRILKKYDLKPHKTMNIDFVRCSILVPKEQKHIQKSKTSSGASIKKEGDTDDAIPTVTTPPPSVAGENSRNKAASLVAHAPSDILKNSEQSDTKRVSYTQQVPKMQQKRQKKQQSSKKPKKVPLDLVETHATPVNNLDHHSCSSLNESSLNVLNIPAENKDDFSDSLSDENDNVNVCPSAIKLADERNTDSAQDGFHKATENSHNHPDAVVSSKVDINNSKNVSKNGSYEDEEPVSSTSGSSGQTSFSSNISSTSTAVTHFEPSERKVFECLCKEYNCSASFSTICKRTDLFPAEFPNIELWFRKKKGSFLIKENDQGKVLQVDAFSSRARLCQSYIYTGMCQNVSCSYLYVCKEYVTDSCTNGVTCPWNHYFHNEEDKAWLSRIKLNQFTEEELHRLVLTSTPQICIEYNDGVCNGGACCTRIHMCSDFLLRGCTASDCGLDHEAAISTDRNRAVLERYQVTDLDSGYLKKLILIYGEPAKASQETKSKVRVSESASSHTQEYYTSPPQDRKPKAKISQAILSQSQMFLRASLWQTPAFKVPLSHAKVIQAPLGSKVQVSMVSLSQTKQAYQQPLLQSRGFNRPPMFQTQESKATLSQVQVFQVPMYQKRVSQASLLKTRVPQGQFPQPQVAQAPFSQVPTSQIETFRQAPCSKSPMIHAQLSQTSKMQPTLLQGPTLHTSGPQVHSSTSLANLDKSDYFLRSGGTSGHSANLTTSGTSWNSSGLLFTRNDAFMPSNYQANIMAASTGRVSAARSWSAVNGPSVTDYLHASKGHVRRCFFGRKTMKIMPTIIIFVIISTVTFFFYSN